MTAARFRLSMAMSACLSLAGFVSCSGTGPQPERVSADRRPAARHAVHSERLRVIMAGLGADTEKVWPQEIAEERAADVRQEQESRFEEARQLAAALGEATDQIPNAIAHVELAEEDRAAFLAGVGRLKKHARDLEAAAVARDFDRMQSVLPSIQGACNGCHAGFRELAGPLQPPAGFWVDAK